MGHHTTLQARAALRGGFIALASLAGMHLTALASEPMPRMPPEKQPATWQQAGIEAALTDPDFVVQYHALDYCLRKKWVVQLHFPTAQWLKWLGHENLEVKALAAESAGQLGAQMPAEVQRALASLRKPQDADTQVRQAATRGLLPLGAGMIPEVQLELVTALDEAPLDYELHLQICQALGQTGAAMTPATLKALLALVKDPQTAAGTGIYAAKALAHLGPHMPPQVRELMLGLLPDARADITLRSTAAEALGRLGPQMPPEVRQALQAAYAAPPPAKADADASKYHTLFHRQVAEALGLPPDFQQALLDRFLKSAHAPQPAQPQDFGSTPESDLPGAELRILAKAGAHASPAVHHALLAEFQSTTATDATRESIAEYFFQPLAERGGLPPEVQHALLACVQDEKAGLQARRLAAETLGHLGAGLSPESKQALLLLLQNKDLQYSALLAMRQLGPHMPPEAGPVLVGIVEKNIAADKARLSTPDPSQPVVAPAPGADPFGPSAASPAAAAPPTAAAGSASPVAPAAENPPAPAADTYSMADESPIEIAVPALGNLGEKMPPEAQTALLGVILHQAGTRQTPWDAAYALAQVGDKLPLHMQQLLIALLRQPEPEFALRLAIYRTLGVSGVHPASDAQVAELLAMTYAGGPDPELRFYLHLWLGRSAEHLQAVRWLGNTQTDPPLGDTTPQEILRLISRLWPHSAAHPALRHAMARRTSQILTTHLKSHPLDEPLRKALLPLATQLAEDPAPDCATALRAVQSALAAGEKAR